MEKKSRIHVFKCSLIISHILMISSTITLSEPTPFKLAKLHLLNQSEGNSANTFVIRVNCGNAALRGQGQLGCGVSNSWVQNYLFYRQNDLIFIISTGKFMGFFKLTYQRYFQFSKIDFSKSIFTMKNQFMVSENNFQL